MRTYRVKRAMYVLAHATDNLGIKELSQFVAEIHCCGRLPTITGMTTRLGYGGSKNGNDIADGHEFLHPRSVPVCRPDAAVTGSATDCFRLIRSVDANMRLA